MAYQHDLVAVGRVSLGAVVRTTPFREQNRRTVTVKMIMDSARRPRDQGRLVINNSQVYAVQLCGMLTSVDQDEACTNYWIDDGTSCIRGRVWPTNENGSTDLSGCLLGGYYVVNGTISAMGGEVILDTLSARPIHDYNSITEHFLSVIHEYLVQSRRQRRGDLPGAESSRSSEINVVKESVIWLLSTDEERSKPDGVTRDYLMHATKLDSSNMSDALESLINEGLIYNTIDEVHYKLAE